jgi:hypothetical protein
MDFATKSGDLWLGFISEKIYLDSELLQSAIVEMAENFAGLKGVDKVTHEDKVINGHKWNRTEIHLKLKSTPIVYENFHTFLKGSGSIQIVFWTTNNFFLATKAVRKDVSGSIRLLK